MKYIASYLLPFLFILSLKTINAQQDRPICTHYLNEINSLKIREAPALNKTQNPAFSYDVKYYRMNWFIDPAIDSIKGSVLIGYKVTTNNFNTIAFDMDTSLHVDSILYHGQKIYNFSFPNFGPINISLNTATPAGQSDTIQIFYHGRPNPKHRGFVQDYHKNVPIIWTLSEPFYAKDWWPCKQDLDDKADSIDVFITVPEYCKAACNGKLRYVTPKDTFLTYYWHHAYPITPYLVGISVTNYKEFSQWIKFTSNDSMPILNYVWPEDEAQWRKDAEFIIPALKNYGQLFERYPFSREKYGYAEFSFGGGQEHQTMTFARDIGFYLMVHEMGHQWFGDKVTCHSWQDIWLNEGFASYCECLSYEYIFGNDAFMSSKKSKLNTALQISYYSVAVDDTTSSGRIFNYNTSYCKGAMVLHMLRYLVGDSTFFHAIRSYLKDPALAYSFAQTSDLRRHFEQASGLDLGKFFDDWIYRKGFPQYTFKWKQAASGALTVNVLQTTSDPSVSYYSMPVPVQLWAGGKETTIKLLVDSTQKEFVLPMSYFIDSIVADPKQDILAKYEVINLNKEKTGSIFFTPNPATDFITLEIMDPGFRNYGEYTITDVSGRLLLQGKYENAAATSIDISRLAHGVYIFSFHSGSKKFSKKLVKE